MNAPFRVGISGSYGGLNLGDEAILEGIIGELRRALPVEVTVFSRDPGDTLRRHRVERAVPVREFARDEILPELERLDLLILGGGGILFDAEARIYLREVSLAHELGVPVMVYAVSAGPLRTPHAQEIVRQALELATVVTVRDKPAKRLLEECGVRRPIEVTADPALLLQPAPLGPGALAFEGLGGGRPARGTRTRVVGMSIREAGPAAPDLNEAQVQAQLADVADYVVDRLDADVVFVPMERAVQDMQQCHAVLARMRRVQRAHVLRGEYGAGELLSLVAQFEFAIGMRLHFLIFAALQRVPFVALPYSAKVSGFVEELGLSLPPQSGLGTGRLIAHIDRAWDDKAQTRAHIERELPRIQARSRRNGELAAELLRARASRNAGEPTQPAAH